MELKPKKYEHLLGNTLFSNAQLKAHLTLYEGYVKKLNEITAALQHADKDSANYSFGEYSELRRREPVAYNGTLLHELYFDALGKEHSGLPPLAAKKKIVESYGTWDDWVADMKAAANSAHGWALVVYDPRQKMLRTNLIQSEHHIGLFADVRVIVALDLWEHAYTIQFGIDKAAYLEAFFKSLDWETVMERMNEKEKMEVL